MFDRVRSIKELEVELDNYRRKRLELELDRELEHAPDRKLDNYSHKKLELELDRELELELEPELELELDNYSRSFKESKK